MLTEPEFVLIARELRARTGAVLSRDMSGAAEIKLQPLSRREGFTSVSELISAARIRPDGRLWAQIADHLVAVDTRFFRDRAQFATLRSQIIPAAITRRAHDRLRIWSAACSTGQEPYSIAMILEALRQEGRGIAADIIASDISERLIEKARSGLYTQFEVQRGLPIRSLIAHFEKAGDLWRIGDRLRAAVRFETHNLLKHPGALGAQFDIIMLGHTLGQFDADTRRDVVMRAADALAPGGVIVLGAHETLPEGAEGLTCADGVISRISAARTVAA